MRSDPCPTKISLEIYKMFGSNIQVGRIFLLYKLYIFDS